MRARSLYLQIAVVVLLLANGALLTWVLVQPSGTTNAQPTATGQGLAPPDAPRPISTGRDLQADERRTVELFERASPSVAFITTMGRGGYGLKPQSAGSGFVWDQSGHIVTNFHVIAEASEAVVTLADGSEWPAKLVGAAPDQDLAVLRIEAPADKLRPIPVGASAKLKVGQFAMAIGNPFGLDQTLTTGIISALDREMDAMSGRKIYGVIQTDASINPGNSGGPLIDSSGRLIGVNSAIRSPSGSSAGIGFAVPVDTVNRIIPQLIKSGHAARPGLGVLLAPPSVAQRYGVRGAVIRGVNPGSPAEQAGLKGVDGDRWGRLQLGDTIVGIDGHAIASNDDLMKALDGKQVGDEIVIQLQRDKATREVKVPLAAID